MSDDSLIMSPSLYKEWKSCGRKGIISSNRFLGNIHTVYGRAYEYGAKILIQMLVEYKDMNSDLYKKFNGEYEYPESDEEACKYIVGIALMESSKYLVKFNIEQHKEKNVFTLALGLQHTYYWFESFLDRNNVEDYEERMVFNGPNFTIGGAYDFMAQDITTSVSSLYDFKGITSLWNYSFPSSPQLPIYTVLKQMTLIAKGQDKVMSMNGGYVINMTSAKKEDDPFLYIPTNTKLVLANLENMMEDFIKCAKELKKLQTANPSMLMQYLNAPVGLETCTANFNCFHLSECENSNFATNTYPDDRVFDKFSKFEYSDNLLKEAIKKIRANSSITNLVDGDGIISGDVLGEDVVNEFFDTDNIALGEL